MTRPVHKAKKHPCCRPGYRGELCELLEALLRSASELFDKYDCLNSDGRRLFESLAKMLLEEHPEHRRIIREARKKPCIEVIARLASSFYTCDVLGLYRASRGSEPLVRYEPYHGSW